MSAVSSSAVSDDLVTAELRGAVCIVRLNREPKLNAMNEALCLQLLDVLASDLVRGSRVVVLAGSARAFSAGADLTEFTDDSVEANLRYYRGPGRVWEALPALPQPSIAAISGWAIGGGLELALSADLRIADTTARFGLPEVSLGILPSSGGMTRLVRLLGTARAKELILLGQRFDAARALELGVISRVVEEGQAETAALEWAELMAAQPQAALQVTRELIDRSIEMSLEASLAAERAAQGMLSTAAESYRVDS
jgi:enoyl-CoA hydratase/carnithine racemase